MVFECLSVDEVCLVCEFFDNTKDLERILQLNHEITNKLKTETFYSFYINGYKNEKILNTKILKTMESEKYPLFEKAKLIKKIHQEHKFENWLQNSSTVTQTVNFEEKWKFIIKTLKCFDNLWFVQKLYTFERQSLLDYFFISLTTYQQIEDKIIFKVFDELISLTKLKITSRNSVGEPSLVYLMDLNRPKLTHLIVERCSNEFDFDKIQKKKFVFEIWLKYCLSHCDVYFKEKWDKIIQFSPNSIHI